MFLPRASTPILLATCLLWHVATAVLPHIPLTVTHKGTVYCVVPEGPKGLGTPRDFREQGGISNHRLPAAEDRGITEEWQRLRDIRIHETDDELNWEELDAILLDLEFSPEQRLRETVQAFFHPPAPAPSPSRVWIYEVATAPHVLLQPIRIDEHESFTMTDALGGIVWSQVLRYTQVELSHPAMTEYLAEGVSWVASPALSWVPNADYNREWEEYGAVEGVPLILFQDPPGDMTRPQFARELMNLVTSSQVVPDQSSRQRLQRLLDWNVESEPQRDFPLLRVGQPPRLEVSALLQVDWSAVQIPSDTRIALLSGLATLAQCAAAVRPFMDLYFKGSKGKRQEQKDACNELSSLVKDSKNVPKSCSKIKNIELHIRLSDKFMEGTWDIIGGSLEGPAGKAHFVFAQAPDAGTQKTIKVEMKKNFGSDEIDINGINKLVLTAKGVSEIVFWNNLRNDPFTIQDIMIHAECSNPSIKVNNNKYVGINRRYRHPGKDSLWEITGQYKEKEVGTLEVNLGDWTFSPPCDTIKELKYSFKIADVFTGGTFDNIFLTLGKGKRILLGSDVDAGYSKDANINLKDTFGSETVNILDLEKISLAAELGSSWFSGDKWTFQGITFEATCANIPTKMRLAKFASVNKEVQHQDNAPSWTGDISAKDWLEE